MSLSSGLCAKEQFPTYWHLRPFCAWMQSCGWAWEGLLSPLDCVPVPVGGQAFLGPHGPHTRGATATLPPTPVLTSYCCGKLRMDGSGLTDTHFLLALDITRRTRRSLVQLQDRAGSWLGRVQARALGCVTSTVSPGILTRGARWGPAPPGTRPAPGSPVPCLGAAVLEVFVRLHHLSIPPALAAHELHLQVKGAGPVRPRGAL